MITATIEMNITDTFGIIQCSRKCDDIIDITRDGLIRRHQCRDIFHTGAHRIDSQIQPALAGKTGRTSHPPNFPAIFLHQEVINVHTIQTAAGHKFQTVKGLFEQSAIKARKLDLHLRIDGGALHRPLEITDTSQVGLRLKLAQQRQIEMRSIERQVKRRFSQHIGHRALDP